MIALYIILSYQFYFFKSSQLFLRNNVKILLKVSKIPKDSKLLVAQATLNGKSVNKKQHVEGDNKVAIPLSFKKLNPCPAIGDSFSGNVNGTNFSGTLTSLKKPNKVNVVLS
jgi:hypothetical protein